MGKYAIDNSETTLAEFLNDLVVLVGFLTRYQMLEIFIHAFEG